jgi:hypothetical protein
MARVENQILPEKTMLPIVGYILQKYEAQNSLNSWVSINRYKNFILCRSG